MNQNTIFLKSESLFINQINNLRSPKNLKCMSIPGWFSKSEALLLYKLVMLSNGAILEIGHFLGRSTASICQAIADSKQLRIFLSYDIGFKSPKEFLKFYNHIHKRKVEVPHEFQEHVFKGKTITSKIAKKNLSSFKLEKYVKLISGNFIKQDHHKYPFIFCDAVHEVNEISLNVPHIMSHSEDVCLWAFHDMNEENISYITKNFGARLIAQADSLGVFIYQKRRNTFFISIKSRLRALNLTSLITKFN